MRAPPLLLGIIIVGCSEPPAPPAVVVSAPPADRAAASALPSASPERAAITPPALAPVRLGFAGDLALTLSIGSIIHARARGERVPAGIDDAWPFSAVRERVAAVDLAVGNLECVTSPIGVPQKRIVFSAPVEAIPLIRGAGFDVVSVANNHTLDLGEGAFRDMLARLDAEPLPYIGASFASAAPEAPLVRVIRGLRIGLFAYHEVDPAKAYREVAAARARGDVDVIVVVNHWGREHEAHVQVAQRSLGRGLVDAGADLVVGAHTHVLQAEEWYRGRLIVYGLGNFVFAGMNYDEPHRTGGWLEVDVDRRGLLARRLYRARLDDRGAPVWLDAEPHALARIGDEPPRAREP